MVPVRPVLLVENTRKLLDLLFLVPGLSSHLRTGLEEKADDGEQEGPGALDMRTTSNGSERGRRGMVDAMLVTPSVWHNTGSFKTE